MGEYDLIILLQVVRVLSLIQVDLDSLNISIGEGALELNSVLLNCDYINEQLVRHRFETEPLSDCLYSLHALVN